MLNNWRNICRKKTFYKFITNSDVQALKQLVYNL